MSLFLLLIFSFFFILMLGIGVSIMAWIFFLFGGMCLIWALVIFGIIFPPIPITLAIITAFIMIFFFTKHREEKSGKIYLSIALLCLIYVIFQCITTTNESSYWSTVVMNEQLKNFEYYTVDREKNFFIPFALIIAVCIFYSIFKNNRKM